MIPHLDSPFHELCSPSPLLQSVIFRTPTILIFILFANMTTFLNFYQLNVCGKRQGNAHIPEKKLPISHIQSLIHVHRAICGE